MEEEHLHLERCDPTRIAIVFQTCFRALLVLVNMWEGVENGRDGATFFEVHPPENQQLERKRSSSKLVFKGVYTYHIYIYNKFPMLFKVGSFQ